MSDFHASESLATMSESIRVLNDTVMRRQQEVIYALMQDNRAFVRNITTQEGKILTLQEQIIVFANNATALHEEIRMLQEEIIDFANNVTALQEETQRLKQESIRVNATVIRMNGAVEGSIRQLGYMEQNVTSFNVTLNEQILTSRQQNVSLQEYILEAASEVPVPPGTIMLWGSVQLPVGYIELNGQSTYAFPNLQPIFGARVPDLRGRFVRAWDNNRGIDPGRALNSQQASSTALPQNRFSGSTYSGGQHSHSWSYPFSSNEGGDGRNSIMGDDQNYNAPWNVATSSAGQHSHSFIVTSGGDAETRPMNYALMYIVKV